MSLVNIHAQLDSHDEVLEKEASVEMQKLAEEDAAGRIMARGFMDELNKIAQQPKSLFGRSQAQGQFGSSSAAKPMKGLMNLSPGAQTARKKTYTAQSTPRPAKPFGTPAPAQAIASLPVKKR